MVISRDPAVGGDEWTNCASFMQGGGEVVKKVFVDIKEVVPTDGSSTI